MKLTCKPKLVKTLHSYTFEEISELFNIHVKTVHTWKKAGLKIIDDSRPFLVMGYDLKEFIKDKIVKRKVKLMPNEFYCARCNAARMSKDNEVSLKLTGRTMGKDLKEMIIKGFCEHCNTRLNRFSHLGKIDEVKNNFNIIDFGGVENE